MSNTNLRLKNKDGVSSTYPNKKSVDLLAEDGSKSRFIYTGAGEDKTVLLDMAGGNQVVGATAGDLMAQVTVTKPATLIPENIISGINIGGVVGTASGGGASPYAYVTDNCTRFRFEGVNIAPAGIVFDEGMRDYLLYWISQGSAAQLDTYFSGGISLSELPTGSFAVSNGVTLSGPSAPAEPLTTYSAFLTWLRSLFPDVAGGFDKVVYPVVISDDSGGRTTYSLDVEVYSNGLMPNVLHCVQTPQARPQALAAGSMIMAGERYTQIIQYADTIEGIPLSMPVLLVGSSFCDTISDYASSVPVPLVVMYVYETTTAGGGMMTLPQGWYLVGMDSGGSPTVVPFDISAHPVVIPNYLISTINDEYFYSITTQTAGTPYSKTTLRFEFVNFDAE